MSINTNNENETWIDLGRCGDDRIGFFWEREKGIGVSGYCGNGKTNIVYRILSKILEHKSEKELEIHIFSRTSTYLYRQFDEKFSHIVEREWKLHKIRAGLNKIVKEIERRKKKMLSKGLSFNEMQQHVKGSEIDNWKEKFIILDDVSSNLIELRKLVKNDQYLKHMELMTKLVEDGPSVGIKPIFVFIRSLPYDAPKEIVNHLSVLLSFSLPEKDYKHWNLDIEGIKRPKKTGEGLISTSDYKGFIKTYNIDSNIENREGIFYKWDPYKEVYQQILSKLE